MSLEELLISYGYSKEDANKIIDNYSLTGYKEDTLKQKTIEIFDYMNNGLNYSREEVIKMTKTLPAIYSYSIENIKEKMDFYDSIDMHRLAVVDTKQLMQSVNLSYSKYMFFKDKHVNVSMDNYRLLFTGNKLFEKRYGISKEELIEKYNYEEYKEKENGRTI